MKTIGFLGGMTYHSTAVYYTLINGHVQRRLGGSASAPLLLHSFNHAETAALFAAGRWDEVADRFAAAAAHLRAAGAHGLAIGCNAGHKVAAEAARRAGLPLLHIADPAAAAVRARGLARVGLLGTRAAMEDDFIKGPLGGGGGAEVEVEVLVPGEGDRAAVDAAVFGELGAGVASGATRAMLARVVRELVARGAQAVVLACTDLRFVVRQEDVSVPLLDTMELHAEGIADWLLAE